MGSDGRAVPVSFIGDVAAAAIGCHNFAAKFM
jgi:hypothetical protein